MLNDVPFAPFSKFDRLGKAADWTGSQYGRQRPGRRQYQGSQNAVNTVFSFQHTDDSQFQYVDNKTTTTRTSSRPGQRRGGGAWGRGRGMQREADRHDGGREQVQEKRPPAPVRKKDKRPFFRENILRVNYSPSVELDLEWDQLTTIQLSALGKASVRAQGPETVAECGAAPTLNKAIDVAGPRKPIGVPAALRSEWRSPRAVEDKKLMALLADGTANIVTTDKVLTALMTASRSVYPFDLVLHKQGDKIVIDRRVASKMDLCTSHETAPEGVSEDHTSANAVPALTWESDAVNGKFQVISAMPGTANQFGGPAEFDGVPASPEKIPKAFRYQKFDIGNDNSIVVRCEIDAVSKLRGEQVTFSVKALHEFDLRPGASGWRSKIQTQRGAVFATEIKNNAHKVARWAAQAVLGGIDRMSIGYVSRKVSSNRDVHELLSVMSAVPSELAAQIAFNLDNAWGVVRSVVDTIKDSADGMYLLTRDSSQPAALKMFAVPAGQFDEEEPAVYFVPEVPEE